MFSYIQIAVMILVLICSLNLMSLAEDDFPRRSRLYVRK